MDGSSIGLNPVINRDNIGEIRQGEICSYDARPVFKPERHVLQYVPSVLEKPWDDIFDNSMLIPPPFFTTFPTLFTILVGSHPISSDNMVDCLYDLRIVNNVWGFFRLVKTGIEDGTIYIF
jgi:hypothetical protein